MNHALLVWTRWVVGHAGLVLSILAILTIWAGYYAVTEFRMNNDTSKLIRQDTDWKQVHNDFVDSFPQYDQNTSIVLTSSKPNALSAVTQALAAKISARQDVYSSVFAPGANDFTEANILLYVDSDQLNDTISQLADAQPFLTAIAEHNSMRGVLELLTDAITVDEDLPTGIDRIADAFEKALARARLSETTPISWRDELFQIESDKTHYQLILLKGKQEFGKDLPNGLIIGELEDIINEFQHPYLPEVTIRITGQVPLEHGEIVSAWESVSLAGTIALIMLIAVLFWGVRSTRIIAATYLSMLCGLIWTAAWAMLTVGQYNTISVMFLVVFIGLGVDFAIHLCLKYQESLSLADSANKDVALIDASQQLGITLILCGITSGIGFLAFVPTEYIALRELGIISGGGMVIAVVVSLTLIPAFFAVTKEPPAATELPLANQLAKLVADNAGTTSTVTIIVGLVCALIATQASFDYSTLSLKDPDSEAMTTLQELHDEDIVTDYALNYMAADLESAEAVRRELETLDVVSEVITPFNYLPEDQEEKLYLIEEGNFLLDSVFYASFEETELSDKEFLAMLETLHQAIITEMTSGDTDADVATSLQRLSNSLSFLTATAPEIRASFSEQIVPPLRAEIDWLRQIFSAEVITIDDLPAPLLDRLIAEDGRAIVSIRPADNVVPVEALRRFTENVRTVVPEVTGRPVLDLGIGEIVLTAFSTALLIAIGSIFIILLLTLRSIVDSILVFIPLCMTALIVLNVSVLVGMPLNMANIVAIPLIFGLGVDNGIHIVKRFHQLADVDELVHSSTPKAVFLSNLTSFSTFGALSVSTHQGIYSIGILLTVGLLALMFLTLISLPALLATFSKPRHSQAIS